MRVNRFLVLVAALLISVLLARADQLLGLGRITSANQLVLPSGYALGTYHIGKLTPQSDAVKLQGSGSTDDGSLLGAEILPSAEQLYLSDQLSTVDSIPALRSVSSTFRSSIDVQGYYAAGDGGGGRYRYDAADKITADNACTVIVGVSGARWKLNQTASVDLRQCGAKGDGVTDDTAAVKAAFSIPYARITDVRGGNYAVSGANGPITTAARTTFVGAGRDVSNFVVTSANATVFRLADYRSAMRHFSVSAGVTQTSGSLWITQVGPESAVEDFHFTGHYQGILNIAGASKIFNGRTENIQSGGIDVRVEGGDNSPTIDGLLAGAETNPNVAAACIRVRNSSALTITNTSCLQHSVGLLIDPYTNTASSSATDAGGVYSFNVSNSFFDRGSKGIAITPVRTASVARGRFVGVWTGGGSSDGVSITNFGSGSIKGIYFIGHHSVLNTGSGISTGGPVSDVQVIGGCWAGNAFGAYFNPGLSAFTSTGASWGPCLDVAANTNSGVVLSNGLANVTMTGNSFVGQSGPLDDQMTATSKMIVNNLGLNPRAKVVTTVGASPWTYTNNTGAPITLYISGGAVSSITADSNTVAANTDTSVQLAQGSSAVITYSAAPDAEVRGQ